MIGWLSISLASSGVLAAAVNAYFKFQVARAALKGVPAKERAAVVDALARLIRTW